MIGRKIIAAALLGASHAVAAGAPAPAALAVAAAANVRPAFEEIRSAFERKTGARVVASYGASGILARQIEQGAPFDLFLSADASFVSRLEARHRVAPGGRTAYAEGALALVTAPERPRCGSLQDLADPAFARIAVAKPEIAPYGRAAMEALARSGWLDRLRPRLVFAESVRDALRYVESGDADAGFAAESEARETSLARYEVPRTLYAPIRQEAAVVATSAHRSEAAALLAFLLGPEARAIWTRHGYLVP